MKYMVLALALSLGMTQIHAVGKTTEPPAPTTGTDTASEATGSESRWTKMVEVIKGAPEYASLKSSLLAHKVLPTNEDGSINQKKAAIYVAATAAAIALVAFVVNKYKEEIKAKAKAAILPN